MLIPFSQKDPRWKDVKLGKTNLTIGKYGCFLTSLAMLEGHSPIIINEMFIINEVYVDEDNIPDKNYLDDYLIDGIRAAKILGRTYQRVTSKPNILCIAETNFWEGEGSPQHFFIWCPEGSHIDPLTGKRPLHNYPVVSWRLFKEKGHNGK